MKVSHTQCRLSWDQGGRVLKRNHITILYWGSSNVTQISERCINRRSELHSLSSTCIFRNKHARPQPWLGLWQSTLPSHQIPTPTKSMTGLNASYIGPVHLPFRNNLFATTHSSFIDEPMPTECDWVSGGRRFFGMCPRCFPVIYIFFSQLLSPNPRRLVREPRKRKYLSGISVSQSYGTIDT